MNATETKLAGFTEEIVAALEAAGWIRGTECGYRNHTGFVRDGHGSSKSLTATKKRGVYCLATIRGGICEYKSFLSLAEVLAY